MNTKKFFDTHNHSEFSGDSVSTVKKSVISAIEMGLGGICFTDHYEFPDSIAMAREHFIEEQQFNVELQQKVIDEVQIEYPEIKVLKGVEIGYTEERKEEAKALVKKYPFDQVILSIHQMEGLDPWIGEYYKGKTYEEAYGGYLEALYEGMCNLKDFDSIGHYDYIARYPDYPETAIMYKDFPDLLDEMFKFLIYKGKALEINTKTYKELRGRTPTIDMNLLKRYKELGGELICLASDSHSPFKVGDKLDWAADIVASAGFKYITHFENRKPISLLL